MRLVHLILFIISLLFMFVLYILQIYLSIHFPKYFYIFLLLNHSHCIFRVYCIYILNCIYILHNIVNSAFNKSQRVQNYSSTRISTSQSRKTPLPHNGFQPALMSSQARPKHSHIPDSLQFP